MPGREKIENLLGFKAKRLKGKMNEYDAALAKVSELFTQDVHVKTLDGEEKIYNGYADLSNGLSFQESGSFLHPFSPKESFSKKMKFYLLANGVEAKDILAYANDPESQKGKEVSEKVNSLKNDFFSMVYQGDDRKMGEYYGRGMKRLLQKSRQIYDEPMTYDSYSDNFDIMYEIDGVKDYFSDLFADRIKSNFALLGFSEEFRNQGVSPDDMSEYFNFLEKPMRALSEADKNDLSSLAEFHSSMNEVSSFMNSREHDENLSKDIIYISAALSEGKEEREKTFNENVSSLQSNDSKERDDLLEELYFNSVLAKEGKLLDNNGTFSKINSFTEFSPALIDKLLEYDQEKQEIIHYSEKYNDNKKFMFDHRNITEMFFSLAPIEMEHSDRIEFAKTFIDDFYTNPEKREQYLKQCWNHLENFDENTYDFSCLTEEGNRMERSENELTKSERDVYECIVKYAHPQQVFENNVIKLPEIFGTYSTEGNERMFLDRKAQVVSTLCIVLQNACSYNEVPFVKAGVKGNVPDEPAYTQEIEMARRMEENEAKIMKGMDPKEVGGIIRFNNVPVATEDKTAQEDFIERIAPHELFPCYSQSISEKYRKANDLKDYELIYIDGVSLKDYLGKTGSEINSMIEAEEKVGDLLYSGEHHIDVVSFHLDSHGEFKPVVNSFQHTDTKEKEKFFSNDVARDLRVDTIMKDIGSKTKGKNNNFLDVKMSEGFLSSEGFEEKIKNNFEPSQKKITQPQKSPADVAKDLSDRLSSIDSPWYHINSKEYNNIIDALKNSPEDKEKIVNCCNAYIEKYTNGTDGMNRVHDYGTKRMSLIYQISNTYQMDIKLAKAKEEAMKERPADAEKIGFMGASEGFEGGKQVGTTTKQLTKNDAVKTKENRK